MADLGLRQIDDAVHTFNTWINEIARDMDGDKLQAYHALRAGLFALRDRMMPDEALDLSQQLPVVVRGVFFEGWQPKDTPVIDRTRDAWLATLEGHLRQENADGVDPEEAATATMALLKRHLTPGAMKHLSSNLPEDVTKMLDAA